MAKTPERLSTVLDSPSREDFPARRDRIGGPSLQWQVPMAAWFVIAGALVIFGAAAVGELRRALLREGTKRLTTVTQQLQSALELSLQQILTQTRTLSGNLEVRAFLAQPSDRGREAAVDAAIRPLVTASATQRIEVSLRDAAGKGLLQRGSGSSLALPDDLPGLAPGVSSIQTKQGTVFYDAVAEVRSEQHERLGFV